METPFSLVIATRNSGKTAEIRDLLSGFTINIKDLSDFGPIPPIVENGDTFDENAYLKASLTARYLGQPALADDSGLMVDALDGRPGVLSARYAGEDATDSERCARLLQEMNGNPDRRATFKCVISIAVPAGPALTYEESCDGRIADAPSGVNGFGYDPVFYFPPLKKTFAEMTMAEKSRVSHRGKALRELHDEFDKVIAWINRHMPREETFRCRDNGR